MRVVARDLQDLHVLEDDPTFELAVTNIEEPASVEFSPTAIHRWQQALTQAQRRLLNQRMVASGQNEAAVDLLMSDALHNSDVARDNMSPAYDAVKDAAANGGWLATLMRGPAWPDKQRNKPRFPNRSAFDIPQMLWGDGDEDKPEDEDEEPETPDIVHEAEFATPRGARYARRRRLGYETADMLHLQEQADRFASDVPIGERLTFPAHWDGVAHSAGRNLEYQVTSLRIAGARDALEASALSVHRQLEQTNDQVYAYSWRDRDTTAEQEGLLERRRPAYEDEAIAKDERPRDDFAPEGTSALPEVHHNFFCPEWQKNRTASQITRLRKRRRAVKATRSRRNVRRRTLRPNSRQVHERRLAILHLKVQRGELRLNKRRKQPTREEKLLLVRARLARQVRLLSEAARCEQFDQHDVLLYQRTIRWMLDWIASAERRV